MAVHGSAEFPCKTAGWWPLDHVTQSHPPPGSLFHHKVAAPAVKPDFGP